MNKSSIYGLVAGLTAASIWGGMYVVSKVVLDVIPPFALLTTRLVLGSLTLGIVILSRKKTFHSSSENKNNKDEITFSAKFWPNFFVGLVGYGVSLGFQFVGTKLSTASNGSLVTSATPAFVLIFAAVILREKITTRRVLALIIASLGVVAVIDPRTAQLDPSLFWGNLSLLAAALTWALYSVLVRKVSQDTELLWGTMVMFLGGLPVSLPLGAWEIATQGFGTISLGIIGGVLFLGIISTALAMFLWNYSFATLPAGIASLTFFAQPVVGTFLGWLFLGEKITPLFLFGGVLIGIGLLIANSDR